MGFLSSINKERKRGYKSITNEAKRAAGKGLMGIAPYQASKAGLFGDKKSDGNLGSASTQLGEIYRAEWENWMNQFLPNDRKLMNLATSETDNIAAENTARQATQSSFAAARQSDELSRRGLGTALDADESNYLNRSSKLAEAAALTSNINNTRLHAADRDKAIMSGGMVGGLRNLTDQTG